jgi:hypothetical protein
MPRLLKLALCAVLLIGACKKPDAPKPDKSAEPAKAGEAKPAAPDPGSAKPADPSKPADPAADPAKPADPGAAADTNTNTALENDALAMMRKLGDVFADGAKDCEKLATDLRAFLAENKALMGKVSELEKTQTEAQRLAFDKRNQAVQDEIQAKMEPAAKACGDNKNVQAAMREFPSD